MLNKGKLLLAAAFAVAAVLVDFTSKMLSVVSDGLFIGVAAFLVWQVLKSPRR
jgi:ABC-type nickel/cobalt efflux system permease component RcnA